MPNSTMSAIQGREFSNLITMAGDFLSNHDDLPQKVREIVGDFESKARKYSRDLSEGVQDRGTYFDEGPADKSI